MALFQKKEILRHIPKADVMKISGIIVRHIRIVQDGYVSPP